MAILIVDDDEAISEFLQIALQDEGYGTVVAPNGAVALQHVRNMSNIELIILDMRMPVMDGATFLDHYHNIPGRHAPVIAISAHSQSLERPSGYVVAFLPKPFELDELLRIVRKNTSPPMAPLARAEL